MNVDLQCGANHLSAQSFLSNPSAGSFMEELNNQNEVLMTHLSDLNNQVIRGNVTDKGSNKSMDW